MGSTARARGQIKTRDVVGPVAYHGGDFFGQASYLLMEAMKKMGYPGGGVARFPGVTTSAVNRAAGAAEVPDLNRFL